MAPDECYSLNSIEATREAQHLPKGMKMSPTAAESVVASFVARGWLSKSVSVPSKLECQFSLIFHSSYRRRRYSLGPRTLIELHGYITQTYEEEDLQTCNMCEELVFKVESHSVWLTFGCLRFL